MSSPKQHGTHASSFSHQHKNTLPRNTVFQSPPDKISIQIMPGEAVIDLDRAEQYAEMLGSGVEASAKPDTTSQCPSESPGFCFTSSFLRQVPVMPSDAGHGWSVMAVLRRTQANDRK